MELYCRYTDKCPYLSDSQEIILNFSHSTNVAPNKLNTFYLTP